MRFVRRIVRIRGRLHVLLSLFVGRCFFFNVVWNIIFITHISSGFGRWDHNIGSVGSRLDWSFTLGIFASAAFLRQW
jgi:hypothetical protein